MPIAFFQARLGQSAIDSEKGIITGCKVMEVGKVAHFAADGGERKSVKITPAHIDALLSHAGNRAIPMHLTHDWFNSQGKADADTVEMRNRIGALKAFRKDDRGDLIADAYLKEGETRRDICWGAEHNPEDNMLSAVFSYRKDDPNCLPIDFRAADIVPTGAATTALFSNASDPSTAPKSMDISEFLSLLNDPATKDALKAIIKSVEANTPDPEESAASATEQSPALMSALGITDADKLPEDAKLSVRDRVHFQTSRAVARMTKALATDRTAILAEAKLQSEAATTALLGKGGLLKPGGNAADPNDVEVAIASEIEKGAKDRPTAILKLARSNPALYNTAVAAGKL